MDNSITITKYEPKKKQGLIVIITGNGKGKTTSAMGMALRGPDIAVVGMGKRLQRMRRWRGILSMLIVIRREAASATRNVMPLSSFRVS